MQARVKSSNIIPRKSESLFKEKDLSINNASNCNAKTVIRHNKYVKNHLNNNLIPGMVSFCNDTDYMDAINNY